MFDRSDRQGRNPYIISWDSFLECSLEYEKDGNKAQLHKFFTRHGPETKYVVVYTHPKKIGPKGENVIDARSMFEAIETAAGIGFDMRLLLSAPEEMVFGTNDPLIQDNLHLIKMCLP